MRLRLFTSVVATCIAACAVSGADQPDAMAPAATAALSAAVAAAMSATAASEGTSSETIVDWREAARVHDFRRAYELLESDSSADLETAELRLALGRIALGAGEYDRARDALAGLDEHLPMLGGEIRGWYAQAAAVAGPYDQAAKLLADTGLVPDLLGAARAKLRENKPAEARKLVDTAVKRAMRSRRKANRVDAHILRAEIAEKTGAKAVAIADLRWLLTEVPDDPRCREAMASIERLGGAVSLDVRLEVLASSTTPASLEETLVLLTDLAEKNVKRANVVAFARARALYRAREYSRALEAFDEAARVLAPRRAEALYYGARCAAGAGNEADAVTRFELISRSFPTTPWAERAAFRRAELLLQLGRNDAAAGAFQQYLSRFGKSQHAEAARYNRALAMLSGGHHGKAQKLLSAMRGKAKERRFKASLQMLEGLAALRAGDRKTATTLWTQLVEEQPLTWPALVAHARLTQMGESLVPPLMPVARAEATPHTRLDVQLPSAPALLRSLGLDTGAEAKMRSLEENAAKSYPGRESEALCEMYGLLTVARRRHSIGARAVGLELLMRTPKPSERWAWQCVYPGPYEQLVRAEEERHGLPNGLIHAVMRQESAFKTTVVSFAGARGLMQLMPKTARLASAELGIETTPDDVVRPDINIKLGAFYLGKMLRNFNGSIPLAVAAYNAGPHAVRRWFATAADRDVDLFVARIPYRETRHYVARVLGNLARYQWLHGETPAVTPLALTLPDSADIGDNAY